MKPGVGAAAQATSRDEPLSRSSVLQPAPALSVRPAPPGPEAYDGRMVCPRLSQCSGYSRRSDPCH